MLKEIQIYELIKVILWFNFKIKILLIEFVSLSISKNRND